MGLYIAAAIAIAILIAFVFYDAGWRQPPSEAVAPEGEEPFTQAPSQTQPPRAEVPDEAPANGRVRPEPDEADAQ
jgi:hypothetical protein